MDNRLETLFDLAGTGEVFCDIGCDHGFVSKKALDSGKFKRVVIADISAKSLQKAQKLLEPYGNLVSSYVSNGFNNITESVSVAFIAGMGGEEITSILKSASVLPYKLVLGPQGHSEKVRRILVELGYYVERDFTLYSLGKYYDAISAVKEDRVSTYTELDYKYGKENLALKPIDFINKIKSELIFKTSLLNRNLSESDKALIISEVEELKGILNENN